MPIFMGLDVATTTGWAIYEQGRTATVRSGSFKSLGETNREKCVVFTGKLVALLKQHRPDFCIIERPLSMVPKHFKVSKMMPDLEPEATINPGTTLMLNALFGAAVAVVTGMGIGSDDVAAGTWRSKFFPKGVKGNNRPHWKKLAMEHCKMVKIPVSNSDEAEAVAIAMYGPYSAEWKKILYEKQMGR